MTFCMKKSFEYHQSITKKWEMRRKGKILVVLLPNKSCLYRNLHGFYGSNTKGLVETRGDESFSFSPNPLLVSQSLVDSGFVSSNETVNNMVTVFWTDTKQTLKVI